MGRFTKKLALGAAVILMASMFPVAVMAADGQTVRDFPGWNGSRQLQLSQRLALQPFRLVVSVQ